ncbi:GntR family transcriptional regulator [Enterococcus sp. LJL90]
MIPKYEKIKIELLEEIKNHKFIPGDKFYSEADLKKKFSVSSITAVKALNELTNAGYLYRIQGKGTFVSKARVSKTVKFSDIELHALDTEKVKVLSVLKKNEPEILVKLGLLPQENYFEIKRLRYSDETPFLFHLSYLPEKLVKEPLPKDLNAFSSIYEKIRKDFGIDLFSVSSVETDEITFPEDNEILSSLHLSFREPAVKQVKTSFLPDKSVAEYVISYKHWKYFKTKIEVAAD